MMMKRTAMKRMRADTTVSVWLEGAAMRFVESEDGKVEIL
jgi:hypothetical protein